VDMPGFSEEGATAEIWARNRPPGRANYYR
jgi:hypothetical protein